MATITIKEAAERLHCSYGCVRQILLDGNISYYRLTGGKNSRIHIDEAGLMAWLEARKAAARKESDPNHIRLVIKSTVKRVTAKINQP
jgi:excisionase family DNA binding protein